MFYEKDKSKVRKMRCNELVPLGLLCSVWSRRSSSSKDISQKCEGSEKGGKPAFQVDGNAVGKDFKEEPDGSRLQRRKEELERF